MANYSKITDYAAKDLLLHLDPLKAIKGSDVGAEFDAIATMSATKTDAATLAAAGGAALVGNTPAGNIAATTVQAALNELDSEKAKVGANADITSMTALTAPTVAANPARATDIQAQAVTAFTTGGTSTAYTLTPAPALAALATNQRFSVTFHTAAGATPTLAISGLTAKNLKYRDATGTKQAITSTQVPTGWVSDVFYDGTDYVVLSIAVSGGMPPGAIVYVCQSTAPSGFLKANGAAVSRTTYSELFTAIGTLFGIGDGATTFNLPDLRGEFLRGWDNSRGIDSGRAIGTWQNEELKSHTHALVDGGQIQSTAAGGAYGSSATGSSNTTIANTGGVETRPRNVALLACIKY